MASVETRLPRASQTQIHRSPRGDRALSSKGTASLARLEAPQVSASKSTGRAESLSPGRPPRGEASSPKDAAARTAGGQGSAREFGARPRSSPPPLLSRSRQRGGAGHLETKTRWKPGLRMRGGSPQLGSHRHCLLPPRALPRPLALLTAVQGVPADLGRRHQFQIQSPEPQRHQGERQQQPEAPPQQLDRTHEQQEQRGPGAPHRAAPEWPPPARAAPSQPPAPRPGPALRAHGVPVPTQRFRAAPRPSPPAALQPGAGSCSARNGSLGLHGLHAPGSGLPEQSPAPPPRVLRARARARLSSPRLSWSQARRRSLARSCRLPTRRLP